MTDAEFQTAMEKIRQGDRSGLRDIYDSYGNMIYSLFLSRVHRHQDAEDLTSDFFLKLWSIADQYRAGNGHRSWLHTIARNMAIDHMRRHGREIPVEDASEVCPGALTETVTAEDNVLSEMSAAQLLSGLAEEEREIVQLHIAAELTFREIAEILKRPLGTVAWKYRNAISKLQKTAKEGRFV